ncbi:pyridoxal phosphate-dependent aminotransferase [Lyngbya confervoides]|uniref:Aminotransferase n=1 Tax=Lyngbya confervoides BDU141951 TaxID=1574623 RepID=A0ABD4T2R3_9CYAN|nr:pyridoxal phosphate-dependent aminotransferase [Lyngbya confervoides]MCM1982527.1 pyridoxal phosphate-dependent aminotransferase [Lyngbya confervoides BDU141951]
MSRKSRMAAVQSPIIPVIGKLVQETPEAISLGQGVVFYPPPPEIYPAIERAISDPAIHRYQEVQGLIPLRRLLWRKLQRENQLPLQGIHQVVVTAGSNMGFMNAILAITEPGDDILLLTPYYFNHEMAVRMAGCHPRLVATDENYQPSLAAIVAALTPKTRAIVTISPNNPTGMVYAPQTLQAINQLCQERGLYHISDEAYEYFIYGDRPHCSPGCFDESYRHTISLFSLSKSYGFAGWRIGYMAIPAALQSAMQKIQDTLLICPTVLAQCAALAALQVGRSYPQSHLPALRRVRQTVLAQLATLGDGCQLGQPDGAFYVLARIPETVWPGQQPHQVMALVKTLIRQYGVAVIPGFAFGQTSGCTLRIAYGALAPDTVSQGIDRLVTGLRSLSASPPSYPRD